MIHTLPGNRLEELIDPLATLLAMPVDDPLRAETIMVQHPGMAHWLNMRLAEHPQRRIAMNIDYPLPVTQMWALIRTILGEAQVARESPYQREVLTWRIYALLDSAPILDNPAFAAPNRYWQRQSNRQQPLRRFQLAEELADLYEQYQIYRPDWIQDWEQGKAEHWQAQLWQHLVAADPQHPIRLLEQARARLSSPAHPLPERQFIFGINTLAPLWIDFMAAVAEYGEVDFHILYLNPSDEYWGDLISERQQARQRARWLSNHPASAPEQQASKTEREASRETELDALLLDSGNPLLSSLGEQGQQFVRLLSDVANLETPLFCEPSSDSLLAELQRDILYLRDGRQEPSNRIDESIEIVSAHSALREVQGLHDYLLQCFNDDPSLTPRDVAVMCPNVEQYAPFIEAVFAGRGEDLSESVPPLPCSIADRNPGATDPAVGAFLELLSLPDARFQVSQVISWLQVPAIQARFGFDSEQVSRIAGWLQQASVHWGLDAEHKAQWLGAAASNSYSWAQGLKRLLLGFAWGDEEVVLDDCLLLTWIEGEDARVLGRLIEFLRTLKELSTAMCRPRGIDAWQQFLNQRLRHALFATDSEHEAVQEDLREVIRELGEFAGRANFHGEVPLAVIRHTLEGSLQTPARTGRQFLAGQITVCSMVPMRSIPFRIIAILGLNDEDFPRQRQPLGFDLMADAPPRPGDRSRRGDDRYLFLEALLSARERLYLSYQGRDVKTNAERQASLVLDELIGYLQHTSAWENDHIRQLPLQPFNAENYRGRRRSFDRGWLRLVKPGNPRERCIELPAPQLPATVTTTELLRVLENPTRAFAQQRLNLHFERTEPLELEDSEPFATNHLLRYQLQDRLTVSRLHGEDDTPILQRARLTGKLPEHSMIDAELADWQEQAQGFAEQLRECAAQGVAPHRYTLHIEGIEISGELPLRPDGRLLHWRLANPKGRDYLRLWLDHLLLNANSATPQGSIGLYRGRDGELSELGYTGLEPELARSTLGQLLDAYIHSLCRPTPLHLDLLAAIADLDPAQTDKRVNKLRQIWQGDSYGNRAGIQDDPYQAWFWAGEVDFEQLLAELDRRYSLLLSHLSHGDGTTEADNYV